MSNMGMNNNPIIKEDKSFGNEFITSKGEIYSKGNVVFESNQGVKILGDEVDHYIKKEKIIVRGIGSFLKNKRSKFFIEVLVCYDTILSCAHCWSKFYGDIWE